MKAEDTVMTKEMCSDIIWGWLSGKLSGGITTEAMFERQAQISFKAGIKEVVELLMTTVDYECEDENGSPTISFWFSPEDWETKLKDWGIDA